MLNLSGTKLAKLTLKQAGLIKPDLAKVIRNTNLLHLLKKHATLTQELATITQKNYTHSKNMNKFTCYTQKAATFTPKHATLIQKHAIHSKT